MSQRALDLSRLMRKIAHLSRDFEASVTLCPICKNYLVHEKKKVIQGEKTQQQRSGEDEPTEHCCHAFSWKENSMKYVTNVLWMQRLL